MHKRFQVIFTGDCMAGMESPAVISNLVLDVGISEQKARELLRLKRVVLKRFALLSDAQKMISKLERAGLVCTVEEIVSTPVTEETASGGESILVSFLTRLSSKKK
ncbi:MAG: hypothetical protein M0R77_17250 [Gammaproteobacteria bacterium]|nr:hypothetical protein [Gammaproteobacteria bacterium]